MTTSKKQVAIIAPARILGALTILIRSAPNLDVLATDTSIDSLRSDLTHTKPEVFLLYLAKADKPIKSGGISYEDMQELTQTFPEIHYIVVIENSQCREMVQSLGVSSVLFEGASPREILTAIHSHDQNVI